MSKRVHRENDWEEEEEEAWNRMTVVDDMASVSERRMVPRDRGAWDSPRVAARGVVAAPREWPVRWYSPGR